VLLVIGNRGKGGALTADYDPLVALPPEEVPLPDAPLVRVVAQVRFPPIVSIDRPEFIGPFQEAIRDTYPILRPERTHALVVGPQGSVPVQEQMAWRFNDVEEDWRVSLTPQFLALEATKYTSRSDFLDRLRVVVEALNTHMDPPPGVVERLGVRYIDRVTDDALDEITSLVRHEILGIASTPLAARARHLLSETLFELSEGREQLLARWGHIPPNGTVDPAAIEPIEKPSWILDLDMFSTESRPFDTKEIVKDAGRYAERLYTFFRWTVTKAFLTRYGGKP